MSFSKTPVGEKNILIISSRYSWGAGFVVGYTYTLASVLRNWEIQNIISTFLAAQYDL